MSSQLEPLLARGDPRDDDAWKRRVATDGLAAGLAMSPEQREITSLLLARAIKGGARGVALTGSTAREKRTPISDLDYHVVGGRPHVHDLPADVDVYAISPERMRTKLLGGDDFIQWTLRFGYVLQDAGAFRDAATLVAERDLWPDGGAKLKRISELRAHATRLIELGDQDAAHDQIRAALSSTARGLLLLQGVFPLARSELPEQLEATGYSSLAEALHRAIHGQPSLHELAEDALLMAENHITAMRLRRPGSKAGV